MENNETKAVVKIDNAMPANLIELALKQKAPIEQLEKLLALQERFEDRQAKKAFLIAKSEFQSRCPILKKSKTVKFNQVNYNYIPLGEIANQIKGLLKECGLSYRWETKEDNGLISITCIVSHIDGHSESNTMSAKKDASGAKNEIQQIGSTMTYLQRYSLIGALGISTADMDMDGEQPKEKTVKLTKEASSELLSKAKIVIDEYARLDDLQKDGRAILQQQVKAGLNTVDAKELEAHITMKYEQLKNPQNENS